MKTSTSLIGLAALTLSAFASAQDSEVLGPFALSIRGKDADASVDGFAGACHAGAAIEGLCYVAADEGEGGAPPASDTGYYSFYYNASQIVWALPLADNTSVPSALRIQPSWGSNVATALFYPGVGASSSGGAATSVSYHPDNGTFYLYGGYDDSQFVGATPPASPVATLGNLTNWHLCWQYTGGYYYRSIAWVFNPPARNPSCVPVDLAMYETTA
ncbi:hypothetical protein F4778DRAFT_719250 [Xylariomycetidae sp. FL2044]|nr:hypothetical protein F4778DRAFT_719250 [Xylariomycetidae sp. FL2044]